MVSSVNPTSLKKQERRSEAMMRLLLDLDGTAESAKSMEGTEGGGRGSFRDEKSKDDVAEGDLFTYEDDDNERPEEDDGGDEDPCACVVLVVVPSHGRRANWKRWR